MRADRHAHRAGRGGYRRSNSLRRPRTRTVRAGLRVTPKSNTLPRSTSSRVCSSASSSRRSVCSRGSPTPHARRPRAPSSTSEGSARKQPGPNTTVVSAASSTPHAHGTRPRATRSLCPSWKQVARNSSEGSAPLPRCHRSHAHSPSTATSAQPAKAVVCRSSLASAGFSTSQSRLLYTRLTRSTLQ